MALSSVTTRAQFKDYCLRRLGYPVINIEVSDDQVEDRIDDAVRFMVVYNYDMMERKYLAIQLTQQDLDNGYVTMPEEVLSVTQILPIRSNGNSNGSSGYLFDIQYHLTANSLLQTIGTGDISQYYLTKQYIATIQDMLNPIPSFDFRRFTDRLYFHFNADDRFDVDDFLVVECHTPIDQTARFWSDHHLMNYATALIKRQWASNLHKYKEVQLTGGVKLNATELYQQAQDEINFYEQDPHGLSEPVPMMIG